MAEEEEFEDDEEYEEVTDEEELEDDEEEAEDAKGAGAGAPSAPPAAQQAQPVTGAKEWTGLATFPAATQKALADILGNLREKGMNEMTVIFVGKQGVGKSSTVNSVLAERVAPCSPFQPETMRPLLAGRKAAGFTLNLLDTPGLLDGDQVSARGLTAVKAALNQRKVHAFVYMDRLDTWRVDNSDRAAFAALARNFGDDVWERTVLGFSHGQISPPTGEPYDEFVQKRVAEVRKAVRSAVGNNSLELPYALVENGSRCATNANGEKVLPNPEKTVWLTKLVETLAGVATKAAPYEYDPEVTPKLAKKSDPNNKRKLFILPLLALQAFVIRPMLVKQIRKDIKNGLVRI